MEHFRAKADKLNFISPCGLGDTLFLNAFRKALEKKYKLPIHMIIKPSHAIVMKMFNNDDYSVHEFSRDELYNIAENNYVPEKGRLYAAHPVYSDTGGLMNEWLAQAYPVKTLMKRFFGLDDNAPEDVPVWYPDVPENTGLPDPAGCVLLLPEANSVRSLDPAWWEKIAGGIRREGLTAVQNCVVPERRIRGIPLLPDDLSLVVGFALGCKEVYSLRSGFCDVIGGRIKNLTVFYPDTFSFKVYAFGRSSGDQNLKNILVKERLRRRVKNQVRKIVQKYGGFFYRVKP